MKKALMVFACAAIVVAWSVPAMAGGSCESCQVVKDHGYGFCDHCNKGKMYGLELTSKNLYDSLTGEPGIVDDLKKSECAGCRKAVASSGSCDHCGVHVAHGKVFMSKTAHALARGIPVSDAKVVAGLKKCSGCAKASKEHSYCTGCEVGFVAGRAYKTDKLF